MPQEFNFVSLAKNKLLHLPRIAGEEEEIDGGWKALQSMPLPVGARVFGQEKEIPTSPVIPQVPSPLPSVDFLGYVDPLITIPPDPHGAVGINHVVTASNDSVIVHTKKGAIISRMSFATFFASPTVSDPYMQYDPYLDRYWLSGISTETTNKVYLAVSKTGDPAGDWFRYDFTPVSADGALLLDHPYMGLDNKLVIVGGRKFPGASSFSGTILFAFSKASIAAGDPINFGTNAQTIEKTPTDGDVPCPVTSYGLSNVPASTFYIMQNWNGSSSTIRLSTVTGNIPNLTWNTASALYGFGGSPWSDGNLGNLAEQTGEPRKIAVNDSRISSAIMINGQIWCAHHIGLPASAPTHTAVQWWQLSPTGNVIQRGRIDDPSGDISRYFPTIAVNAAENVLIGYTISGSSTLVNAAYSTRSTATPSNTTDDEYIYKGGISTYWKDFGSGRARWGDYSHTVLDPSTGNLWTIQEYAEQREGTADNKSKYGLWWAEVAFNTFNNDAALSTIIEPNNGGPYCDVPIVPSIVVSNIGKNVLKSVSVGVQLDGVNAGSQTFSNLSLDRFDNKVLSLNIPLSPPAGNHIVKVYTFNPNNVPDQRTSNDTAEISFTILPDLSLPFSTGFENAIFPPAGGWTLFNPDAATTWQRTNQAAKSGSYAMLYNGFNYDNKGQTDILRSPKISLNATDSIILSFDVAYARHSLLEIDSLQIVYSTDCGTTWLPAGYRKQAETLATNQNLFTTPFIPGPNDWRSERVSLSACGISSSSIMLGLKAVNDYGNNIFIDNLAISKVAGAVNNVAVLSIDQPAENLCTASFTPSVNIINKGSDSLHSLDIQYQLNNVTAGTFKFNGSIPRCGTRTIPLNPLTPVVGVNTLQIVTSSPNGKTDEDLSNDTLSKVFYLSPLLETPVVEGFEQPAFPPANWTIINEDKSVSWERTNTAALTGTASMVIRNYEYASNNTADKFISPVIQSDPKADSFFVSFDYATAPGLNFPGSSTLPLDTLEILITQDCGQTFTSIWKKWGSDLQTVNQPNAPNGSLFTPVLPQEWRAVKLFLSPVIDNQNFQVYFAATSNHQNNIYVDNINIYKKILPPRLKNQGYLLYPNPFSSSFVLRHLQPPVNLQRMAIYNSIGQLVYSQLLNGTANTELTIDLTGLAPGVYFVKLLYTDKTIVERIIKQ